MVAMDDRRSRRRGGSGNRHRHPAVGGAIEPLLSSRVLTVLLLLATVAACQEVPPQQIPIGLHLGSRCGHNRCLDFLSSCISSMRVTIYKPTQDRPKSCDNDVDCDPYVCLAGACVAPQLDTCLTDPPGAKNLCDVFQQPLFTGLPGLTETVARITAFGTGQGQPCSADLPVLFDGNSDVTKVAAGHEIKVFVGCSLTCDDYTTDSVFVNLVDALTDELWLADDPINGLPTQVRFGLLQSLGNTVTISYADPDGATINPAAGTPPVTVQYFQKQAWFTGAGNGTCAGLQVTWGRANTTSCVSTNAQGQKEALMLGAADLARFVAPENAQSLVSYGLILGRVVDRDGQPIQGAVVVPVRGNVGNVALFNVNDDLSLDATPSPVPTATRPNGFFFIGGSMGNPLSPGQLTANAYSPTNMRPRNFCQPYVYPLPNSVFLTEVRECVEDNCSDCASSSP
jgi:hypothetical protein